MRHPTGAHAAPRMRAHASVWPGAPLLLGALAATAPHMRSLTVSMSENNVDRFLREAAGGGSAPPNQGGSRVVNLGKSRSADLGDTKMEARPARSLVLAGALLTPFALVNVITLASKVGTIGAKKRDDTAFDYEGDAVTAPNLETSLLALVAEGPATPSNPSSYAKATLLVSQLEQQGGSQLFASRAPGKWCLPWVGGWDRVWVTDPEKRFPGGPSTSQQALSVADGEPALKRGNSIFSLTSARQFIYGPGEGGMVIEYLHSSPGVKSDLLLTQLADIKNLGGNFFEVSFPGELIAYAATKDSAGNEVLKDYKPITGDMAFGPRQEGATLQTTYLSATMWILRDEDGRRAVFSRTETKSVADRRGLQVDGQVREHPDEQTRYGKLLFSESLSDYSGWEQAVDQQAPSENIKRVLSQ